MVMSALESAWVVVYSVVCTLKVGQHLRSSVYILLCLAHEHLLELAVTHMTAWEVCT